MKTDKSAKYAAGGMRFVSIAIIAIAALGKIPASQAQTLAAAVQSPAVLANLSISLSLTAHATLPPGQTAAISSITTSGTHGVVVQTSGTTITYAPGAFYSSLAKGSSAVDSLAYCLSDPAGSTSCSTVRATIFGAAAVPAASYSCVRNWYVAQNGSDRAGGSTATTPWRTLQRADDSGLLRAGDCVNVAPGTYPVTTTTSLRHGGSANSPTGYVVYRSTTPHGAKIIASAQNMGDVIDVQGDYMIIDGFEINGGNFGLASNPFTTGSGLYGTGHHFQALNNLVHDCGGAGIAMDYEDWYWVVGNTTYDNAFFSPFHESGIAIYEPRAVSFTPTSADTGALYHIIIKNNVSHDNSERYVKSARTDGNGITLDDFRNSQTTAGTPYPYRSLVQGNTVYGNGASGVHVYQSDRVTVDSNTAFDNNQDTSFFATWRGEVSNSLSSNNIWTNNQLAATSVAAPSNGSIDWRIYNTAVLDGHVGAANVNVIWSNNANIDTRTGGRSYKIDDPARAAAFPANNPLGKALSPT